MQKQIGSGDQVAAGQQLAALQKYYTKDFLPALNKNSDSEHRLEHVWPATPALQELQALYIAENPNPTGEKDNLVQLPIDNAYTLLP